MKPKPRAGILEEELFLLKIKYGTDEVDIRTIQDTDYKYFEKLAHIEVFGNIHHVTHRHEELINLVNCYTTKEHVGL